MTDRIKIALFIAIFLVAGIVLYFFNPTGNWWMPKCMFYAFTGYKCPSCGSMRAVHSLLHLQWSEAWHYNLMLPVLVGLAAVIIWLYVFRPERWRLTHTLIWCYVAIFCLWWIVRNLLGI